jgi:hypothetical protein
MHDRFWWIVLYLLIGLLTLLYVWARHGYPGSYWSGHYASGGGMMYVWAWPLVWLSFAYWAIRRKPHE